TISLSSLPYLHVVQEQQEHQPVFITSGGQPPRRPDSVGQPP
ncbi:hypothetical protein A2U01_0114043, partial [Trifolium medium]|nr:hypothetical protein [Trifolium medium]